MKLNKKEITIFYHGNDSLGKKTLAVAISLNKKVNRQNLVSMRLSTTVLRTILEELGLDPKQLMNKSHPFYQKYLRGADYDLEGWLNILQQNPYLIKGPIAMYKNRAILCESPTDVMRISN